MFLAGAGFSWCSRGRPPSLVRPILKLPRALEALARAEPPREQLELVPRVRAESPAVLVELLGAELAALAAPPLALRGLELAQAALAPQVQPVERAAPQVPQRVPARAARAVEELLPVVAPEMVRAAPPCS